MTLFSDGPLELQYSVTFNSFVVSKVVFNYSKSIAPQTKESKYLVNADYDMKSNLA